MTKRILLQIVQVIGIAAGVVVFLAPIRPFWGLVLTVCSIVVFLVCLVAWLLLGGGEGTGYWPDKPNE